MASRAHGLVAPLCRLRESEGSNLGENRPRKKFPDLLLPLRFCWSDAKTSAQISKAGNCRDPFRGEQGIAFVSLEFFLICAEIDQEMVPQEEIRQEKRCDNIYATDFSGYLAAE